MTLWWSANCMSSVLADNSYGSPLAATTPNATQFFRLTTIPAALITFNLKILVTILPGYKYQLMSILMIVFKKHDI